MGEDSIQGDEVHVDEGHASDKNGMLLPQERRGSMDVRYISYTCLPTELHKSSLRHQTEASLSLLTSFNAVGSSSFDLEHSQT